MKRKRHIPLIIVLFLSLLTGCASVLSILDLTTPVRASNSIEGQINTDQPNEGQLINDLISNHVNFSIVSLDTAVNSYLHGSRIVAVAGCVDQNNHLLVLVTTPDFIRTQREQVRDAVHQFNTNIKEKSCTPIELDERTLIEALKRENPNHHYPSRMNLSWFIDRSFSGE